MSTSSDLLRACRYVMQDVKVSGSFRVTAATTAVVEAAIERAKHEPPSAMQVELDLLKDYADTLERELALLHRQADAVT